MANKLNDSTLKFCSRVEKNNKFQLNAFGCRILFCWHSKKGASTNLVCEMEPLQTHVQLDGPRSIYQPHMCVREASHLPTRAVHVSTNPLYAPKKSFSCSSGVRPGLVWEGIPMSVFVPLEWCNFIWNKENYVAGDLL